MRNLSALLLCLAILLSFSACVTDATSNGDSSSHSGQSTAAGGEISFTELVAVDNELCLVKITKIEPAGILGYTLKVLLENRSSDKTYMFAVNGSALNGVECETLFATEVAPGKKSEKDVLFADSALQNNSVGDYTDVELSFRVYDTDDWTAPAVAEETVHVYPYGEDKAAKFVRAPKDTDTVLVDDDNITVVVTGYEPESLLGYTANLFLVNKTDKKIMFSVDEASVNGIVADPVFAKSVGAGKCAFTSIAWSSRILEENSISDVAEIVLKLAARCTDDPLAADLFGKTVTLRP